MKIRFQVSQKTNIDYQIIKGIIQLKLRDEKYTVTESTDRSIKFYDNPWVLGLRSKYIRRLDGGIFTINNTTDLILNYYLDLLQPLIGLSIPVIGTIIVGAYDGTIFFITFIIIALCIQTVISRNVAKGILTSIINDASMV